MEKASYILMVFLIACAAGAYAQVGDGSISGFVQDEQKAFITGAQIVLRSEALMGERITNSGANGGYRIINLPPGIYTVEVSKDNYQAVEYTNINVRAGKTSSFNITLKVGEFTETLTIIHDSPIIDVKNPERSLNIDGDFISRMPLSPSREWYQIWSLVPGVDSRGSYVQNNSWASGNQIEVHGQGLDQNIFAMDGMSLNQVWNNTNSTTFSTEIIEDIQVVTSGYNSSINPGTGGYINVVTKSGGNEFDGSAVFTLQPSSWNWSNVEGGDSADLESYVPEASLGGPIMRDRIWFFMGYRYDLSNLGVGRTAEQLAAFDRLELPRPTFKIKQSGHRIFSKVTTNLTSNDKIVFTYNWDRNHYQGAPYANQTDDAVRRTLSGGPFYALDYSRVWSDTLTSSLKASYRTNNTGFDHDFHNKGRITRAENVIIASWGVYPDYGAAYIDHNGVGLSHGQLGRQTEIRGDANWYVDDLFGSHEFGFGFSGRPDSWFEYSYHYPDGFVGAVETKNSEGQWIRVTEYSALRSSNKSMVLGSETWGGYGHDTWVLNDRFTLNFGLRFQQDYDNTGGLYKSGSIGGDFGITYALTSDQKQSVRFGISRKQEEINGAWERSEINSGSAGGTSKIDTDLDGTWDIIQSFNPMDSTPINYLDNPQISYAEDFGPALLDTFQIGYSIVLPLHVKFDVAFLYNINHNGHTTYNDNWIWENGQVVGVNDPSQPYTYRYINDRWSSVHYRSFELLATKEFSSGWQLLASYTNQDSTLKGQWNPHTVLPHVYPESWFEVSHYGNLAPHLFNLAASFILPYDIILNANINARAGYFEDPRQHPFDYSQPYYITLPDGSVTQNPYRVAQYAQPRNAERSQMNGVANVNIGIGKQFRLGSYTLSSQLQIFNLFNDGNYTDASWNVYYDENMQPLGEPYYSSYYLQSPRAAQLLIKMTF